MPSPPTTNPILDAYESFCQNTPLVTRLVLTSTSITYIISFIFDPAFLLVNTPRNSILKLQLYRLFLSPFICEGIFNLIFGVVSFLDNGKRLEYAAGSTNFAALLLSLGGIINTLHNVICFLFYAASQEEMYLTLPSGGIWLLILAVTAKECAMADPDSKRRLFVVEIPTRYYPCALLGLFALFSGSFQLSYVISVCVGYLDGYGKLDFFTKLKAERRKRLENGVLRKFTGKKGFVPGPSGDLWNEILPHGESENGQTQRDGAQGWTPTVFRRPYKDETDATIQTFEGTAGHRLGSSSRNRPNASTLSLLRRGDQETVSTSTSVRVDRAALLAAAEKRFTGKKSRENFDEEKGGRT